MQPADRLDSVRDFRLEEDYVFVQLLGTSDGDDIRVTIETGQG